MFFCSIDPALLLCTALAIIDSCVAGAQPKLYARNNRFPTSIAYDIGPSSEGYHQTDTAVLVEMRQVQAGHWHIGVLGVTDAMCKYHVLAASIGIFISILNRLITFGSGAIYSPCVQ